MSQQLAVSALLLAVILPASLFSLQPNQVITVTANTTSPITIQDFGAVEGTVLGQNAFSNYEPLVWATINATDGQQHFVTYSGGGGLYHLSLPVGTYDLTISQTGYCYVVAVVTISKGALVTANVKLDQSYTYGGCFGGFSANTASSFYRSTLTVTASSGLTSTEFTRTPEFSSDSLLLLLALVVGVSLLTALHRRRIRTVSLKRLSSP